jgi:carbon-monoxide dehydrogenase small subunit
MRSVEFSGNPIRLRFTLNGEAVEIESRPDARLIDLLRDRLGLTGAKVGCDIGRCGACMVLVDGNAVNGCLVMAYRLEGATIVTAEALDLLAEGRAARAGLSIENAFQCGYCAPGMTVSLTAVLIREPLAQEQGVREGLAGNLCRCTGYHSIIRGAKLATILLREERSRRDRP